MIQWVEVRYVSRRLVRCLALAVILALGTISCGRIGFEPSESGDAAADALGMRDVSGPDTLSDSGGADSGGADSTTLVDVVTDGGDSGPLTCDPRPCADPTFGDGGVLRVDFDGVDNVDYGVRNLAERSDGRLVLFGEGLLAAAPAFVVRSFNEDGGIDTDFASSGTFRLLADGPIAHSVRLDPAGRILCGGNLQDFQRSVVFRLSPTGALDDSFGMDGVVTLDLAPGEQEPSNTVLVHGSGRISLGGQARSPVTFWDWSSVALLGNGDLDTGFAGTGFRLVDGGGGGDEFGLSALHSGDAILHFGSSWQGAPREFDCGVSRIMSDGSTDLTFGGGGIVLDDYGGTNGCAAIVVSEDGGFVLAGYAEKAGELADLTLSGFLEDGTADMRFATGGTQRIDLGGVGRSRALAVLPDGRLALGGQAGPDSTAVLMIRLADGTPDVSVGPEGQVPVPWDFGPNSAVTSILVDRRGRLLVVGDFLRGGNRDFFIVRIVV